MRRIKFLRLGMAVACVLAAVGSAEGQSLGLKVSTFKVVPKLSVLERSGGIAGVSEQLRLSGSFDLQILPPAIYPPYVAFDNAEIWGSLISDLPHPAVVEDVDDLLNLENLNGRMLAPQGELIRYQFEGKLDDGSSIKLGAAKIGAWLYVRGFTTPPPGSADFFEYQLRMVARSGPFADLNDDGVVDAADYTLLRDGQGGDGTAAIESGAKATFDDWRAQYGERLPNFEEIDALVFGLASGFAASAAAVPEPTSAALMLLVAAAGCTVRLRRKLGC